jgi:hypothetical protein
MTRKTAKTRWHICDSEGVLTLARRRPARFDFAVCAGFAQPAWPVSRRKLAHQIRQDMWRALQHMRGFCPVVQVSAQADGLRVRAGGAVAGQFPRAQAEAALRGILDNPANQQRWFGFAAGKNHA